MKVYQVYYDMGYDGEIQYGIFSTIHKAIAYCENKIKIKGWKEINYEKGEAESLSDILGTYYIQEWILDKDYNFGN